MINACFLDCKLIGNDVMEFAYIAFDGLQGRYVVSLSVNSYSNSIPFKRALKIINDLYNRYNLYAFDSEILRLISIKSLPNIHNYVIEYVPKEYRNFNFCDWRYILGLDLKSEYNALDNAKLLKNLALALNLNTILNDNNYKIRLQELLVTHNNH